MKRIMKTLAIITGLLFAAMAMQAQTASLQGMVEQANQSYSSANYETAILEYESVINAGYESAGLYFNLGNAYFKTNNIPAAILYYEKAGKLDPTDESIQFNIDLANSRIIDKLEPLPQFFLKTWWKAARDTRNSDQWARLGIISFILLLISAAVFIISTTILTRKLSFWSGIVFLGIMALSLIFSVSGYNEYSRHSSGIVFTPTVTVKSSPSENSVDLFVIHEGIKVFINDQVEGWSEVRLANGNVGWIKNETYRPI